MVGLDILLLIPLGLGAFMGYRRGLLVEIFGLLALVLSIVFGFRFLAFGTDLLAELLGADTFGNFLPYLGFLLIFFPSVFLINKLGWLFSRTLRITFLGVFDGIAGAVLGVLLWLFGLSVLCWLAAAVGLSPPQSYTDDSQIYPILLDFAPNALTKLRVFLPTAGEIFDRFKSLIEQQK